MARPFDNLPPLLRRLGPPSGQARREVLLLPGAWQGPGAWRSLAGRLAAAGHGVSLLELPGHGSDPWDPPALTSLADYAGLARRAAGSLGRPVLLGQGLGGWLAQKILEVADLPALLLAPVPGGGLPWPGGLALARTCPRGLVGILAGRPLPPPPGASPGLGLAAAEARPISEPARVMLEMLLGLARAKPLRGRAPRLVVALEGHHLLPLAGQARLAARLGAGLAVLPAHAPAPPETREDIVKITLDFLERT